MRSIVLVCALLAILTVKQCLSCSCQLEHPTQQYCRAQFVIKAKVVSKQEIYPTEEPVPEPTTNPLTTFPPTPSHQKDPQVMHANLPEPDFNPNVELLPAGAGFQPPGGGFQPPSGGLTAPGGIFGGLFPPAGMYPGQNARRPIMLEYTIKVDKIFKADENVKGLDPKTIVNVYTPPFDGMCGVGWLENGKNYLLSGSYWDDKLRISTCNWVKLYDDLTRRQKQGVKTAYKHDCYDPENNTNCQICLHENCGTSKRDRCVWDAFTTYEDCESLHSRCTRNSRGKCQWQRKKEYKKCDLLRQQVKASAAP